MRKDLFLFGQLNDDDVEWMINTGRRHLFHDLFGDNVSRREFSKLMLADHEPFATGVDQLATFPTYCLAHQRQLAAGSGTQVEHGRVELDEFDVP